MKNVTLPTQIMLVALVVFLIAPFLTFYSFDFGGGDLGGLLGGAGGPSLSSDINGWDALDLLKLFWILALVIGVVLVAALAGEDLLARVNAPRQLFATIVTVIGALATLYLLFRLLNVPGNIPDGIDVSRSYGLYIAVLAGAAWTFGGYLMAKEEGGLMVPQGQGTTQSR